MQKTLHIAYAADHNYVFICAVSILSLIRCANCEYLYEVHILTDDSLTNEDKRLFDYIEKQHKNISITIHLIHNDLIDDMDYSYTYLNKMTLYRLLLGDILPNVNKVLYLDSDTYVWGDISDLFGLDISDVYIAGALDSYIVSESEYIPEGLQDKSGYVNAGVLCMNLEKIRVDSLQEKMLEHISKRYLYNDQDILNVVCQNRILHFDDKYNYFSFREGKDMVITHFASEFGTRPWDYIYAKYTDEWWETAKFFDFSELFSLHKQRAEERYERECFAHLLRILNSYKKIYIWGSGKYGVRLLRCLKERHQVQIDGIIDNDKARNGEQVDGVDVLSPDHIRVLPEAVYIVSNQKKENVTAICKQLKDMGAEKNQIYCYVAKRHVYLISVDPKYRAKFEDEFWMEYECGV